MDIIPCIGRSGSKKDLYAKGGCDSVIMVTPTSGSKLAKQLQHVLKKNPGLVKIKVQG